MGRRRLPAAERRKQLLNAAIQAFARHGYRGATTKRIAAEADVAEALLYRYFGSKHALFGEAVDRMAKHLLSGLRSVFEDNRQNPMAALRRMLELYEQTLAGHRDLAKMIFVVSAELDDPEVRDVYLPHQKKALKLIREAIDYWQKQDFIRDDVSPHSMAWLFLGVFQALALMKHAGQVEKIDINEALRLAQPFISQKPLASTDSEPDAADA